MRAALADLEAAKDRLTRDNKKVLADNRAQLVRELLPVLDGLDKSLATGTASSEPLLRGVDMVRDQLLKVIAGHGAERFASLGEVFDPRRHEAMAVVPVASDDEDGRVLEEWESGYLMAGKILRPAKVAVGKKKKSERFDPLDD